MKSVKFTVHKREVQLKEHSELYIRLPNFKGEIDDYIVINEKVHAIVIGSTSEKKYINIIPVRDLEVIQE